MEPMALCVSPSASHVGHRYAATKGTAAFRDRRLKRGADKMEVLGRGRVDDPGATYQAASRNT